MKKYLLFISTIACINLFLFASCDDNNVNIEPEMVQVDGGTFNMGSNDTLDNCARPVHSVTLNSYKIGKYEITQQQWTAIIGINKSKHFDCDSCPVDNVSWDDVQEYITKLNKKTKKNYRLPTEAEWEFAAKGGNKTHGSIYAGSNNYNTVANNNTGNDATTYIYGQKQPNELGIYDMTGNVWEWCNDYLGEYQNQPITNPKGPDTGKTKVLRGGGWHADLIKSRVTNRESDSSSSFSASYGFRVAL